MWEWIGSLHKARTDSTISHLYTKQKQPQEFSSLEKLQQPQKENSSP